MEIGKTRSSKIYSLQLNDFRYDIILDAAGVGEKDLEEYVPYVNTGGSLITLRSPLLNNIDTYGLLCGSVKSVIDLAVPNLTSGVFKKGSLIKWGFFMPLATGINEIAELVNQNKVRIYALLIFSPSFSYSLNSYFSYNSLFHPLKKYMLSQKYQRLTRE